MIYNMTIFEKKKFTDQDRRYIQPPSLIRNGGKLDTYYKGVPIL